MVDGTCLENRRTGNGTVGSNPTLSAILLRRGFSRIGSKVVQTAQFYKIRRGTQEAEGGSLLNC